MEGAPAIESDTAGVDVLIDAGAVLAESLDLRTTLERVARLTIPRLSDLCVIDLLGEDGAIRQMAVAAADESIALGLRRLSERQHLDPAGEHPVARVIRGGRPELLVRLNEEQLSSFAEGSEHERFMLEHGYRSAVVAPLLARSRTLGVLSVLRLGEDAEPYDQEDLALVNELAHRAALAIDNARLFSEVRRVEQRLEAILYNLAEAITLVDPSGRVAFANQAAARLFGANTPLELVGRTQEEVLGHFGFLREQAQEQAPGQSAASPPGGEARPRLLHAIVRDSGEELWLVVRPAPLEDPETGRMLFQVNVYENVTEIKRAELAESFMAEATRVLASSLDYTETLGRLVRLTVPRLADWCAIDLLDEDGGAVRVTSQSPLCSGREELGLPEAVLAGEPRLYTEVTPEGLARDGVGPRCIEALLESGARSALIVPLQAPTRTIGALTLMTRGEGRRLTHASLALTQRLAGRAATAVERARLYTERKHIADTLQAALLPSSLPAIPGLDVEALYRAAGELNQVGGDFYDVIECGEREWLLVIGDVCGKGPRAAGVTALARHTLRAAAMLGQDAAGMLRTLHEAMRSQPNGSDLCTVCLVRASMQGERVRLGITLAGHPRPLLLGAGRDRLVGRPGTLLGVLERIETREVQAELEPGQTLVLYTDGVTETARARERLGEEGLLERAAAMHELPLRELLRSIERAAIESTEGSLRDDIALLAMRLRRS